MTCPIQISTAAAVVVLSLAGCAQQEMPTPTEETVQKQALPPDHPPLNAAAEGAGMTQQGAVLEAIGAAGYTYLRVDTGQGEQWLAAPQLAVEAGDWVMWAPGTAMPGWHSETLDRTWEEVYFVSQIQLQGAQAVRMAMPPGHPPLDTRSDTGFAPVEKLEGGLTVAELHARAADLSGQPVALRGRVTKVTPGILGSNWLHVQDGTGDAAAGTNDLTVTTGGQAAVGDLVIVEGTLVTDKDFGAGYRYAVLVENARVEAEPASPE